VVSAIFRPGKAMRKLLESRRPVRRAALFIVGVGVLYSVTSAVLAVAGAVPMAPVFFGMDVDNYYFWQMVFVLPWTLASWLFAVGIIRLLGSREKGGPGLGGTAALGAVAMVSPLVLAWVPSAVETLFQALGMGQEEWVSILSGPGPWQTAYLVIFAVAAALTVRNFMLAARLGRKKSGPGAVIGGIAAAAVMIGAYLVVIR